MGEQEWFREMDEAARKLRMGEMWLERGPKLLAAAQELALFAKAYPFNPIGHSLEHNASGRRFCEAIAACEEISDA